MLGDDAKAAEMNAIADNIRTAILTLLWDDGSITDGPASRPTRSAACPASSATPCASAAWPRLRDAAQRHHLAGSTTSRSRPGSTRRDVNTWSRIFDFGTGTTANMFLTINAGSGPRFAITTGGGGRPSSRSTAHRRPAAAEPVDARRGHAQRHHRHACTSTASAVGTNTNMTLRPSSLGNTTQNWIGRSQYGDPTLNGIVDDFQIYDRALDGGGDHGAADRTRAPATSSPTRSTRRAAPTLLDSSGNNRARDDAGRPTVRQTGKVFKMRDVARNALVPWKDQQNFSPFTEGVVPNTDNYKQALRFYADKAEFPIMPSYTANQFDKAEAHGGRPRRHEQLLEHQLDPAGPAVRQGAARLPVRLHHAGHVPQPARVGELERVRQRRQPLPGQQRVLLQLEPDQPDARALGHPPQHPRRVQLHDHRRHRGPAPAPRRCSRAVADRRRLGPLPGRQPAATTGGTCRSCGTSRATTRATTARRPRACRSTSTAAARSRSTTSRTCAGTPRAAVSACSTAATRTIAVRDQRRALDDADRRRPGRQRPRRRHVPEGRRRPDARDRRSEPRRGQAGDARRSRRPRRRCRRPRRRTRSTASRSAACRCQSGAATWPATRSGARSGSPNAQDWLELDLGAPTALRHGEAVLLRQQAVRRRAGNTYRDAVGVQRAVPRRGRLGRRAEPGQEPGAPGAELQQGHVPGGHGAADARPGRPARARSASASRSSSSSTPARQIDRSRAASAARCRPTLSLDARRAGEVRRRSRRASRATTRRARPRT